MNHFRETPPRSPCLRETPSVAFFGEAFWTPTTVRSRHFPSVEVFRLIPSVGVENQGGAAWSGPGNQCYTLLTEGAVDAAW